MISVWYFAYGSNLCQDRLGRRITPVSYNRIARLPGHDFRFHKHGQDDSGKADAFATGSPDDAVWGVLVEVDAPRLATLDRYEPGYDRVLLEVEIPEDGSRCFAQTYVAQPTVIDRAMLPFAWYRRLIIAGGAARGLARLVSGRDRQDAWPLGLETWACPRRVLIRFAAVSNYFPVGAVPT